MRAFSADIILTFRASVKTKLLVHRVEIYITLTNLTICKSVVWTDLSTKVFDKSVLIFAVQYAFLIFFIYLWMLRFQISLHKDECSFTDSSEILDRHSDCLKSQSGDILNAGVTTSEPSYYSGEQNSLR